MSARKLPCAVRVTVADAPQPPPSVFAVGCVATQRKSSGLSSRFREDMHYIVHVQDRMMQCVGERALC